MPSFTVLAVENHPVNALGLTRLLRDVPEIELWDCCADVTSAFALMAVRCPQVLLLSQAELNRPAVMTLNRLRDEGLSCAAVLWLGSITEAEAIRAVQAGARGVLRKTAPAASLVECLTAVAEGRVWIEEHVLPLSGKPARSPHGSRISPREREIIRYVCRGMKNKEIAHALSIAVGTVKVHLLHIFEKTGVSNRFQLAAQGDRILEAAQDLSDCAATGVTSSEEVRSY